MLFCGLMPHWHPWHFCHFNVMVMWWGQGERRPGGCLSVCLLLLHPRDWQQFRLRDTDWTGATLGQEARDMPRSLKHTSSSSLRGWLSIGASRGFYYQRTCKQIDQGVLVFCSLIIIRGWILTLFTRNQFNGICFAHPKAMKCSLIILLWEPRPRVKCFESLL